MAYYLDFDGTDDYVELPMPSFPANNTPFECTIDFACANVSDKRIIAFGSTAGSFFGIGSDNLGSGAIRLYGSGYTATGTAVVFDGTRHTVRFVFDSARILSVYVDGSTTADFSKNGDGFDWANLFSLGAVIRNTAPEDLSHAPMKLYSFEFLMSGDNRFYDPSASSGTGSVLTDTTSAQNGTLTNFPTDDSQWVSYQGPAPDPSISITGPLQPGASISGTYSNFTGVPTALTLTDSNANSISSATEITDLNITDNGDGTGSFSGTMLSLPTSGTANLVLFGDVTVELT